MRRNELPRKGLGRAAVLGGLAVALVLGGLGGVHLLRAAIGCQSQYRSPTWYAVETANFRILSLDHKPVGAPRPMLAKRYANKSRDASCWPSRTLLGLGSASSCCNRSTRPTCVQTGRAFAILWAWSWSMGGRVVSSIAAKSAGPHRVVPVAKSQVSSQFR